MGSELRVLIVGCGQIAGGFDHDRPAEALPLTHAGAFRKHGGFVLSACVEPDRERRERFMKRWSVAEGCADLGEVGPSGRFDVISICSPTKQHPEHLAAAIELKPKLIFCEKPISPDLETSRELVARCRAAEILLAVNYTRRWAPDVIRLRESLKRGEWGEVRSVVGYYNKGVLNNGGHMVDLLHYLLGPLEVKGAFPPVWDFWDDDPTVSALLMGANGLPIYLGGSDARDYSLFELQIVASKGAVVIEDGGANWRIRRIVDNSNFRGYRQLDAGERREGEYALAMIRAVSNLYEAVTTGQAIASTGESALQAQHFCDLIRRASF